MPEPSIERHRLEVSQDDLILRIKLSGQADRHNADDIARQVLDLLSASGRHRMMVDVRGLDGRLGTTDTYFHVHRYPPPLSGTRTAVIDLIENKDYFSFHETTATNAGHNLRFFSDATAAEAWLRA